MSINRDISRPGDVEQAKLLERVHPPEWCNPVPKPLYDLAIIGAGPAGLTAAEAAIEKGLSVVLFEKYRLGGNSLNTGSVPSKSLIGATRVFAALRAVKDDELRAGQLPVPDFIAVMERLKRLRARIAEYHSSWRLRMAGIDVFFGEVNFAGSDTIALGDTRIAFRKALIATGARSRAPDISGMATTGYRTSETIYDMPALPSRLAVVGGGPLGCELAQAFCRLGAHVIIIQDEPKFLPREERDAAELLSLSLSRDGVETRLNTTVTSASLDRSVKRLDIVNNGAHSFLEVDEILLSIGRVPNIEGLNLAAVGIEAGEDGIIVDDFLRTTNPNVYAAGDVCMEHRFANVAQASASIALHNAFSEQLRRQSHLMIPWCTFCDPEIAHIGLYVREAVARSIPVKTYTIMMQDVDRAIMDGQDDGFVKIHVREGTDRILGATIVASHASEMINEISAVMSMGIGMRDLAKVMHTYPAQSEAIRQAALAFVRDRPAPV